MYWHGRTPKARAHSLKERGFTLVEMIVSVALFAIVMLVCVGALLSLVGANRKVHALQSVIDNLNVTLDGMVRAIRMGTNFHCGAGNYQLTQDCSLGGTTFAFEPFGNTAANPPWVYTYDAGTKRLYKTTNGGAPVVITAPEITIDSMTFYVVGSNRGCASLPCDTVQPKVVAVIKGTAPVLNSVARSTFHIQITAVQRALDL